MIPILYAADETTFSHNGIGRLTDCTSCIVTEERNGIFECEFSYPITGQFYSEISLDRIIKAKPNDGADDQLFRIYRISKPIKGIVSVYCQHISYDLSTNIVLPFRLLNDSALIALTTIFNYLSSTSRYTYTVTSTVGGTHDFKVEVPISARAALGGSEGSILDVFGGEFEFDNFNIKLHQNRGQDTGVTILYGKNLTDIKADSNMSSAYTAILPYAIDEEDDTPVHLLSTSNKTIAIDGAPTFGEPRVLAVDLTDRFDLQEEDITSAKLRQRANDYIAEKDFSIAQNIEISFVQLWQTEEYKNIALLERVGLCDTVTVRYEKLGVDAKAKVVKTVYNTLNEKYEKIELGDAKSNFLDTIRQEAREQGKKAVKENYSAMQAAIDNATKLITGQSGGYVVMNPDSSGKPKEILIMNTEDIQTATKVWRWNLGGLGYAHGTNAYNGQYATAITMDGSIVADFITTGALNASVITAGVLQDAQGKNYWNLNNGNFRLSQNNAFNSLTHDGDALGIYMTPVEGEDYNELRINASYIKSGTIDASVVNVTNINASNINTGALNADLITTGTITSANNRTTISLSTGNIKVNNSFSESGMPRAGYTLFDGDGISVHTSYYDTNINDHSIKFQSSTTTGKYGNDLLYISNTNGKSVAIDYGGLEFSDTAIGDSRGTTTFKKNFLRVGGTIISESGTLASVKTDSIDTTALVTDSLTVGGNSPSISYDGHALSWCTIEDSGILYRVLGYRTT